MKKSAILDFDEFWGSYQGGIHTRKIFPNFSSMKLCHPYLSRKSEKLYYKLSFTQNFLNKFLCKINKSDTPFCRFCMSEVESCNHIFCACKKLDYSSLKMACVRENLPMSFFNLTVMPCLKIAVG